MICYIAGPISSDLGYRMKFAAVALAIRDRTPGAKVINPASLPEGMQRADYMAICLPMLMRSDVVFLLPGWESSGGARIEAELAGYLGIRTVKIGEERLAAMMEDLKR